MREIAEAANVKPNTFVRMARQVGFDGYEDFRAPFRDAIRKGAVSFPDRARSSWSNYLELDTDSEWAEVAREKLEDLEGS